MASAPFQGVELDMTHPQPIGSFSPQAHPPLLELDGHARKCHRSLGGKPQNGLVIWEGEVSETAPRKVTGHGPAEPKDPPRVALLVHSVTRGIALAPVVAGAMASRHTEGSIPEEAGWALTATHTLFPTRPLLALGYC